jgi:hypothetical protein
MAERFDMPFNKRNHSSCAEARAPRLTEAVLARRAQLGGWLVSRALACAMIVLAIASCHRSGLLARADSAVAGDTKVADGPEDAASDDAPALTGPDASMLPVPDAAPDSSVADACVPVACSRAGTDYCGTICDGCGGMVNCPADCGSGRKCDNNQHMCVSTACVPFSSCQRADTMLCGLVADGCGGVLNCGNCPAGQTCERGLCAGAGGCTPLTCTPAAPYQDEQYCGVIDDCCGGNLDCGSCRKIGWECQNNVCRSTSLCPPSVRCQTPEGFRFCGDIGDNCGGTLKCPAQCPASFYCRDRLCIPSADCLPVQCEASGYTYCGRIGDGCGGALNCPTDCSEDGWICQDNLCVGGPSCPRLTCAPPGGHYCGTIGDNCGGTLHCGECPAGSTCALGRCQPTDCDGGCTPGAIPLPPGPPDPPAPAPPLPPFPPLPPLRYQCPAAPTTPVPPPVCPEAAP